MVNPSEPVSIGYELHRGNIPRSLDQVIGEAIETYQQHHPDLESVFVIGSVALGDFKTGISDLDTIGITAEPCDIEVDQSRRTDMLATGDRYTSVSFVDNTVIDRRQMDAERSQRTPQAQGIAEKLALTGLCVWGEPLDFKSDVPSVGEMAYGRTERARLLMEKYRSGNIIEAFQRDERLLTRSCAKAAMRVMSGMTLLRGAEYQSSPFVTADLVEVYAPEASGLAQHSLTIIDNPIVAPEASMQVTDDAVGLFYELFPPNPAIESWHTS